MKRRLSWFNVLLLVLLILLIWYFSLLPWNPYLPLAWWYAPRSKIEIRVPKGYLGPVLIAYEVPDGKLAEKEDDIWIYPLQADGALLLRNERPQGVLSVTFRYETKSNSWETLTQRGCYDKAIEETISYCVGGTYEIFNAKKMRPHQGYEIVSLKKGEQWDYEVGDSLIRKYFNRLALSDE